ncbi:MAG TPA: hypothetical protein VFA59_06515 [Vicinamibacterales bacterium]|nr:hypothetical protein [Vicinamibacterales bacterium]
MKAIISQARATWLLAAGCGLLGVRLQNLEAGDHQPVGLARERGGQNRMSLGVASELLGKRDELSPVARQIFHVASMIAHSGAVGNLSRAYNIGT